MEWEKRQKFSIRKFSIGAASVMIGQFYLGTVANAPSVSADERTSAGVETVSQPQESEMSNVTLPDQAPATNQETPNPDTDKVSSEASVEKNTAEASKENVLENEKAQNTTGELSPAQALSQLAKETAEKLPSGKVEEGSQANQTSEPSESAKQNSEEVTKEKTAETTKEENSVEKTADLSKEETVNYDVTYKDIDTGEVVYRDVRQATIPAGQESVTVKSEGKELVNEAALGNYADESGESLVRTATIKRGQTASLTYLVKAFQNDEAKVRRSRESGNENIPDASVGQVVHNINGTVGKPLEYTLPWRGAFASTWGGYMGVTDKELKEYGLRKIVGSPGTNVKIVGTPTKAGTLTFSQVGVRHSAYGTSTPGYLIHITIGGSANGSNGQKGDKGEKGEAGKSFHSGNGNPSTSLGNNGDTYLNYTTGQVYTKNGGTWTAVGNMKGATGAKGDKGDTGAQGAAGASALSGMVNPTNAGKG